MHVRSPSLGALRPEPTGRCPGYAAGSERLPTDFERCSTRTLSAQVAAQDDTAAAGHEHGRERQFTEDVTFRLRLVAVRIVVRDEQDDTEPERGDADAAGDPAVLLVRVDA